MEIKLDCKLSETMETNSPLQELIQYEFNSIFDSEKYPPL